MSRGRTWTIGWFWLKPFVWLWNPFPKRIKVRSRSGGYVLDIKQRKIDEETREAELLRRAEEGEELQQTFNIHARGNVELEGRSK